MATDPTRSGFSKEQEDLIKTARANLIHCISGPGVMGATEKYKKVEEVVALIEKLLGY